MFSVWSSGVAVRGALGTSVNKSCSWALSYLHTLLFYFKIYRLQADSVGFCRSIQTDIVLDCTETMVRDEITHASSYLLWLFFFLFEDPPLRTRLTPTPLTERLTNMMNFRRAAPPWRHLIIEKRQETYSFFILLQSHPAFPLSLCLWLSSLLPSPVRLFAVKSGGVHVSRSGGERCTVLRTGSAGHHRITALDNRVVVEGETGPGAGAGAGPGEAPWLFIARSPKTCPSFFYSPF